MSLTRCAVVRNLLLASSLAKLPRVPASVVTASIHARSAVTSPAALPKTAMYIAEERGSAYSPDYRVYFIGEGEAGDGDESFGFCPGVTEDESGPISPMHDIPLWADRERQLLHMVVEVPRWSNAKMEISLGEPLNPIRQDVKKGALRFVGNVFPHHGYLWNYGALPQTWENPHHVDPRTQARGDNDPVDVIEVGDRVAARGEVLTVRVLGALALLDEGETDWKLLAVDVRDPLAERLRDARDLEAARPGLLRATVEWLRLYKLPEGKPPNEFAFDARPQGADFALALVDELHAFWRALVAGEVPDAADIDTSNVSVEGSPARLERAAAAALLAAAPPRALPQPLPAAVDKWHFVSSL